MLSRSEAVGVAPFGLDRQWLLKRNNAISPRQLVGFYLSIVVVSSIIAGGLTLIGAWMVLPFSGIELLALGIALLIAARRSGDYERVSLQGGDLIVEVASGGRVQVTPLNRLWVRLETEEGVRHRVVLSQHGLRLMVGRFIGDEERRQFGRELRSALAESHARRSWN